MDWELYFHEQLISNKKSREVVSKFFDLPMDDKSPHFMWSFNVRNKKSINLYFANIYTEESMLNKGGTSYKYDGDDYKYENTYCGGAEGEKYRTSDITEFSKEKEEILF